MACPRSHVFPEPRIQRPTLNPVGSSQRKSSRIPPRRFVLLGTNGDLGATGLPTNPQEGIGVSAVLRQPDEEVTTEWVG